MSIRQSRLLGNVLCFSAGAAALLTFASDKLPIVAASLSEG